MNKFQLNRASLVGWIITTSLVLVYGIGSSANAAQLCPQYTPYPFTSISTHIEFGDQAFDGSKITCSKIGIAATMIKDIQRMLTPALKVPTQLAFRMVDQFDNAFFDTRDFSLNVPYQLVMANYSKNPTYTVPVWAHEFGHSVLNMNLAQATQKWQALLTRHHQAPGEQQAIIGMLTTAYSEFFADVVAVLYTDHGNAVSQALSMTGLLANPEGRPSVCPNRKLKCRPRNSKVNVRQSLISRDFTNRQNQMSSWKGVPAYEGHDELAPARYHVWKYYISNPRIHREKGRIARVLVNAIVTDVSRRLDRMAASSSGPLTSYDVYDELGDVFRTNRDFIRTMDAQFKAEMGI